MTKKEYLQEKLARVERAIAAVNSNPNRGFRDDESLCYEALAIQKQIEELEKQEQAD
jgi:hypothetical protein